MLHHAAGAFFSYEDHWLLLAADVVALRIVMERSNPAIFEQRGMELLDYPVIMQEPWHPATRAALAEVGWSEGIDYRTVLDTGEHRTTYREVIADYMNRFPKYLEEIRVEFPASASATMYANAFAEICEALLTWGTGYESIGKDIFEPQELALARFFEYGIFPPLGTEDQVIDWMIQRSIEIARGAGRDLPTRGEMILAANEAWGGYSAQ